MDDDMGWFWALMVMISIVVLILVGCAIVSWRRERAAPVDTEPDQRHDHAASLMEQSPVTIAQIQQQLTDVIAQIDRRAAEQNGEKPLIPAERARLEAWMATHRLTSEDWASYDDSQDHRFW